MLDQKLLRYDIILKLVEEQDAQFIVDLRQAERNKYISASGLDVLNQINWIKAYKTREENDQEYYFIVQDKKGIPWGTTRLYNFNGDHFEVGSWVFLKNSPSGVAIKADIIARELGFEELGFNICNFTVNKDNKSVLRYHYGYQPQIVAQD